MFRELFLLSLISIVFCDPPRIRNGLIPSHLNHDFTSLLNNEDALNYQNEDELISNEEINLFTYPHVGEFDWNIQDWNHPDKPEDMIAFTGFDNFDIAEPFEPLPDDNNGSDLQNLNNQDLADTTTASQGPEIHYGHIDNPNIITRSANAAYSAIQNANDIMNQPPQPQPQEAPEPLSDPNNDDIFNIDFPSDQPDTRTTDDNDIPAYLPPVSAYPRIVTRTARASYAAVESAKNAAQIQNNLIGSLYDDAANPVQTAVTLAKNSGYSNAANAIANELHGTQDTGHN